MSLITFKSEEEFGLVPNLDDAINELDYLVVWEKANGIPNVPGSDDDWPEPRKGIDL